MFESDSRTSHLLTYLWWSDSVIDLLANRSFVVLAQCNNVRHQKHVCRCFLTTEAEVMSLVMSRCGGLVICKSNKLHLWGRDDIRQSETLKHTEGLYKLFFTVLKTKREVDPPEMVKTD